MAVVGETFGYLGDVHVMHRLLQHAGDNADDVQISEDFDHTSALTFPVICEVLQEPQFDVSNKEHCHELHQSVAKEHDELSITDSACLHRGTTHDQLCMTSPPFIQSASMRDHMFRRRRPIEVVVEVLPECAKAQSSSAPPLNEHMVEHCWRVRHMRSDNVDMPTALRVQPDSASLVLQDQIHVQPLEEVSVMQSQRDTTNSNVLWMHVSCSQGQGWIKQQHLKEGGWHMCHIRSDNARIQTALREKPSALSKLLAVMADIDETVLVHCMLDVEELGFITTWVRVACSMGEGWLKREHLQETVPRTLEPRALEATEVHSVTAPLSPRVLTPPLPLHASVSAMQSKTSAIDVCDSEIPATGVRIHLGALEFVGNSVGSIGMFDTVGFRATVQLCGSQATSSHPVWIEHGPCTEARVLKYSRSISDAGQYSAKFRCLFDEALDLPWPPPPPIPEKIAVDIFLERTTVVDRFDRALGGLGLHTPASMERRCIGRALADLPPEGVDDTQFAWSFEWNGVADCPIPQTIAVGVEWVYKPLEEL